MEDIDRTHAILAYGLCEKCNYNPGTELHTCPYSEEIHDDHFSECNCCTACCGDCADDI